VKLTYGEHIWRLKQADLESYETLCKAVQKRIPRGSPPISDLCFKGPSGLVGCQQSLEQLLGLTAAADTVLLELVDLPRCIRCGLGLQQFPGSDCSRSQLCSICLGVALEKEKKAETEEERKREAVAMKAGKMSFNAQFVRFSEEFRSGCMVEGGSIFKAGWVLRNNGVSDWPLGTSIEYVSGSSLLTICSTVEIPALRIGEEAEILGEFQVPVVEAPAYCKSFWRLSLGGKLFGQTLKIEVDIVPSSMSLSDRQCRRLNLMGFSDDKEIRRALAKSSGDCDAAVCLLLRWKKKCFFKKAFGCDRD